MKLITPIDIVLMSIMINTMTVTFVDTIIPFLIINKSLPPTGIYDVPRLLASVSIISFFDMFIISKKHNSDKQTVAEHNKKTVAEHNKMTFAEHTKRIVHLQVTLMSIS